MQRLFAVIRSRGPAWNDSLPMEQQPEWPAHAACMDALHAEGFVLLVGPLEGTPDALLIARASSAEEVGARLAKDVWIEKKLLGADRIAPWTLRLGSLG